MLLTLKARYFAQLLAVVVLVGASPVDAQLSAVLAEDQGIAVTISNYTPYTLTDESDEYAKTNSGDIIGPGFPPTVLPYQHTGTSIFLRGGIASGATATMSYFFNQFNDAGVGTELIFNLNFYF